MLYSKLGATGLIVSRLSLGTMTFIGGGASAAIAKTDHATADAILGRAIEGGVNFIDTADVYSNGQSEEMVGELIRGRRDELVIATKAGWRLGTAIGDTGLSARHLLHSIEASLQRLKLSHVDVYIAHRNDVNTPLAETLMTLDTIVRHGKARYLGVSNWPAWKVAAAIEMQRANGWAQFTHGQMLYSLLNRGIEDEVLPMMRHYGLGVTAWSPLMGGFLSGKYSRENPGGADDRLANTDFIPFDREQGFALLDVLRTIADAHGASVAQVAIAWVLAKRDVASVILGASKLAQLDDNLGAATLALTDEQVASLDAASASPPTYPAMVAGRADPMIATALTAHPAANFLPRDFPAQGL